MIVTSLWAETSGTDFDLVRHFGSYIYLSPVVADLTDETSIRMAPVWKQLALNSATVTGEEDRLPGTLQVPVLLLGNKLDVVSG